MKPLRNMRGAAWLRRTKDDDRLAKLLDRLLTRAEDLLDRGELEEVSTTLAELPKGPYKESIFHLRAGDCFQIIGRLEEAEAHYRQSLLIDPRSADALHGLGLVHQRRGEHAEMVEAWLGVRALDLGSPSMPWSISVDDFSAIAERAFESIPEHIRERLQNLPILVADYPIDALIEEGVDPRTLGLITGVPYSEKAQGAVAIDCVQLYQRNIERVATNREEVEEEIRITVLHETAHYFGLDDDDLDEIGLG